MGIFAELVGEVRGLEFVPIEIEIAPDLAQWRAEIPGRVKAFAEALSGPTTPPGARVQLHNAPGSEVGRPARGRRRFSIHPAEARLSGALSLASEFPDVRLARGAVGDFRHGVEARGLLRGLLLDAYDPSVRRRGHEPVLGSGHRCLRPRGEGRPERRSHRALCGNRADRSRNRA
jgi:hypothetical protein